MRVSHAGPKPQARAFRPHLKCRRVAWSLELGSLALAPHPSPLAPPRPSPVARRADLAALLGASGGAADRRTPAGTTPPAQSSPAQSTSAARLGPEVLAAHVSTLARPRPAAARRAADCARRAAACASSLAATGGVAPEEALGAPRCLSALVPRGAASAPHQRLISASKSRSAASAPHQCLISAASVPHQRLSALSCLGVPRRQLCRPISRRQIS